MRSIAIVGLLALASCGGGEGRPAAGAPVPPSPPASAERSSPDSQAPAARSGLGIPFDPAALTKGTKVGTLVADMLVLSRSADSTTWVGSARFTGEMTVTGRAIPHVDANVHEVCFEPDSVSATGMPRWAGDTRRPWFCFSNQPETQESLAAPGEVRAATVVIDRYTINKSLPSQENSALLVRVVKRGDPVPRP